jgi:hypothetical protein
MQFGIVTKSDHYYKGKVVQTFQHIEQSIAVDNHQELLAEFLKASELILSGQSSEVDFKMIADPKTMKLRRVVKKYQLPIDA